MKNTDATPYHHGNLRRALLDEALRLIEGEGPAGLSLRELARRLGVSHAAPAYHFADKAALFAAIAAEGYDLLADALKRAAEGEFLDVGLAYVRFAVEHPGYIAVMFQPSLYRGDDPEVAAARKRSASALYGGAGSIAASGDAGAIGLAGWCLMHGLATLWLNGNLRELSDDPLELARRVGSVAFRSPRPPSTVQGS